MAILGSKLRRTSATQVAFLCPGCNRFHAITVDTDEAATQNVPKWHWNGDGDKPTFKPSVSVRGVRDNLTDLEWEELMERTAGEREAMLADKATSFVCHSYVRDGMIEFLHDSTHALAGQTVPLLDVEAGADGV